MYYIQNGESSHARKWGERSKLEKFHWPHNLNEKEKETQFNHFNAT